MVGGCLRSFVGRRAARGGRMTARILGLPVAIGLAGWGVALRVWGLNGGFGMGRRLRHCYFLDRRVVGLCVLVKIQLLLCDVIL